MRFLGNLVGTGTLSSNGLAIAPVSYDFDRFYSRSFGTTCSGEIQLSEQVLATVFGRTDIQIVTDGGRVFQLSFSASGKAPLGDVAHVDVIEDAPAPKVPSTLS